MKKKLILLIFAFFLSLTSAQDRAFAFEDGKGKLEELTSPECDAYLEECGDFGQINQISDPKIRAQCLGLAADCMMTGFAQLLSGQN